MKLQYRSRRKFSRLIAFFRIWMALVMTAPLMGPFNILTVTPALAASNTLTINVISARTEPRAFGGAGVSQGDPITNFKYIINIDNTGTTDQRPDSITGAPPTACTPDDPNYPASCNWVSIAGAASNSPIYTQGNQNDFASGMNLPDGRYLISVIADGYKLDGAHFTIPLADPGLVTVELQPLPLPDATIRAFVFEDISPTNSAPDVPVEQGLVGFQGHIADYIGEVTTDVYGNPLCTQYEGEDPNTFAIPSSALDADMLPVPVPGTGGKCLSDANGMLAIPHLGPNRYALSVVPPDGSNWIQTTTLEGNHDWDAWVMEGATGYDTEFVVAGEPFPAIIFGFVHPNQPNLGGTGQITGVVDAVKVYVPTKGGVTLPGTIWGGLAGGKLDKPIDNPWIALSDLQNGDTAIWIGQGDANGAFSIPNVPPGNYTLTWWDEPQDYILNLANVTVANGEIVDLGVLPLNGWWTQLEGYVFNDLNRNGIRDAGEPGLANFPVAMRKRENSLMDRGAVLVTTDATGHYYMENAYPITQWLIMEAYSDLYYTTGVTYQADNQPEPTTIVGAGVDVSVLPIIGLSGTLDWGVHNYAPTGGTPGIDPNNGGIVGTVSYDTTRNELDPRYAAVEDWQPGIPNLNVNLYLPVDCPVDGSAPCDPTGRYQLDTDGSFLRGQMINTYLTETWQRPGLNDDGNCVPRDVNGDPLVNPTGQQTIKSSTDCLEGPLMGMQFQAGFSTVDGNYGFGDACFGPGGATAAETCANGSDPTPLTVGDYLVEVEIPNDATGRPMYQVTKEEDINITNGDQFIPQIPPPECAGPLHTVDVADIGTDGYPTVDLFGDGNVIVPASTPVDNPTFANGLNGSYFEGQPKPLCSTKLVRVSNGKSVAPTFNLFTDVPLPGRFWGLIVDDLNFSSDPKSLLVGEKAGVPFAPVGIYDWTNRLITTVESDYNGLWDVLLPSTNRISCPTPSGVCANLYRFVGNDPGIPGRLNPNFKPQFRTIAAEFEAFPGLLVPADLAPTQVGVSAQLPGGQFNQVTCSVNNLAAAPTRPELFAVSQPYVNGSGSFTISGQGFGASGRVTLSGVPLPTTSWSDTSIAVTVPNGTPFGPQQLMITNASTGLSTINGLTFHVLGSSGGAFPSTAVLDSFNRANNNSLGGNWTTPTFGYRVNANSLQMRTGAGVSLPSWTTSFGADQEAYFTFTDISTQANSQGLTLKHNGTGTNTSLIAVLYNVGSSQVQVWTASPGFLNLNLQATFNGVTFANGDQFGAQALVDGTVNAFQNGALIGSVNVTSGANPWSTALAQGGGQIGLRFAGTTLSGAGDARIDDFGGGDITPASGSGSYQPNVYEVGPGRTYTVIQDAVDAAAASNGDDLVVVFPGTPDYTNPRVNPRGAYYENLIIAAPVKLQGVGPGGFQGTTYIPGSTIDGSAFGGDTALADAWRARIAGMTWVGNQTQSEGEVILLLAQSETQYGAGFNAAIDGFSLRGGDQQGQANIITQGGAVFANAYIHNLQVSNNEIVGNSSSYGTVRIGTPDLTPASNFNENLRVSNNRIIQNAGTNLAGGIAIFAGADNYEVAGNDICGNFSAEYGGGMTAYGFSPNGAIHDNRIYFNESYDEGGGIMIAGELPANPLILSPGSGPVAIYNNLIQNNMANDDGGGLRFLMAGNFPMNVYNNTIVDNISTHEGGGIGINDAPDVRVYNNTIMKNMTTATAVTSNGLPAPAGLSTSANSDLLQATLPGGSPLFSNPLLFNNIFWDNRAGTRGGATVTGIGAAGDATPINNWDLGVADGTGVLAPTNSIIQQNAGTYPYVADPSNSGADPAVVMPYDISVTFAPWRNNPAFVDAIMIASDLPPNLLGNYHLAAGSPAIDLGAASKSGTNAPTFDIDNQVRSGSVDSGADEFVNVLLTPQTITFGALTNMTFGAPDFNVSATASSGLPVSFAASGNCTVSGTLVHLSSAGSCAITASQAGNTSYAPAPDVIQAFSIALADQTITFGALANKTFGDPDFNVSAAASSGLPVSFAASGNCTVAGTLVHLTSAGSCAITASQAGDANYNPAANVIQSFSIVAPIPTIYFSTFGNTNPPGVGGTADDADIYTWNGTAFGRMFDASVAGLPGGANVDGLYRVDDTHFYVSFSATTTTVPGLGSVQDEDVVYYNNGTWSVYFDGTAHGLGTSGNLDIDALYISGSTLYFSTFGNTNPPGVGGTADDADIYAWNGTSYSRVFDASVAGLPAGANVDGLVFVDATHFYVSFSAATTTVPGLGVVEDEDVVYNNNGVWSVYFDGTALGLTAAAQESDAFSFTP
jgi:hypothetical protein